MSVLAVAKQWITDMEDPGTVLTVSLAVLVGGSATVVSMLSTGSLDALRAGVWVVVSVGQLIWAQLRYLTWRGRRPAPDG